MNDRRISNQNLAGLLSEALGLEAEDERSSFSGTSRESLRRALEHSSNPTSFSDLLSVLEELGADDFTLRKMREKATASPNQTVHDFADDYLRDGPGTTQ